MITYNQIYLNVRSILRNAGVDGYSREAKLLTASAAGKTVTRLMRDLNLYTTDEVSVKAMDYASRRLTGEPVAYITGSWEFYGLPIYVTPDVLIPRMDTEVLVEAARELFTGVNMQARILDLCCGSGCITCAVASVFPAARFVDIDISPAALEVCKKNMVLNGVSPRVICMQADALSRPPVSLGRFDMIIANPPYIKTAEIETLDKSVKDFEPVTALDGGDDGLKFYRSIIKNYNSCLKDGGIIIFEVGEEQAGDVGSMLLDAGFKSYETRKDTLGTDRAVIGFN